MVSLELLDDDKVVSAFLTSVVENQEFTYADILVGDIKHFHLFSERIRDVERYVFEAILIDGSSLGLASDRLRDDTSFIERCINAAPKCIAYASDRLRSCKPLVLTAFKASKPGHRFRSG